MLQSDERGGRIVPQTLFRLSRPAVRLRAADARLLGRPSLRRAAKDQQLVCLDLQGKELWNSGRDKFGSAPYMIADGLILRA